MTPRVLKWLTIAVAIAALLSTACGGFQIAWQYPFGTVQGRHHVFHVRRFNDVHLEMCSAPVPDLWVHFSTGESYRVDQVPEQLFIAHGVQANALENGASYWLEGGNFGYVNGRLCSVQLMSTGGPPEGALLSLSEGRDGSRYTLPLTRRRTRKLFGFPDDRSRVFHPLY